MAESFDKDLYTSPFQLTKTTRRDPYEAISPELPANSQQGKIIVITGAGTGIGAATAKVWAQAGALGIVLAGRRVEKLEEVAKQLSTISKDSKVLVVKTDVTVEKDVENLFSETKRAFGRTADVVLSSPGTSDKLVPLGQADFDEWWNLISTHLKGLSATVYCYIRSQINPAAPTGTMISVTSVAAGLTFPGWSAYSIAKLGMQRLTEYLDMEYPSLRVFTVAPGLVATGNTAPAFTPYAFDHADLTGMLALYLSQPKADYLRGSFVSVNWDVTEMEAQKDEIVEKKLLKSSWLPVLPMFGGKGLTG